MSRDKNLMSRIGWSDFTDDDYRETFNIPLGKDVNEFMFDYAEQENIKYYMKNGLPEKEAKAKAAARKKEAMKMAKRKELMK